MFFFELIVRIIDSFFTGDPGSPRSCAAGTVASGADEAEKMPFEALFFGVVKESTGAAQTGFLAATEIIKTMLVGMLDQAVFLAKRSQVFFLRLQLVISDQNS